LLHNPEYFLKAGGQREAYYKRIEKAFKHLEIERAKGRIQFYGISSNTFPDAESRSDYTSLAKVHEIAQTISDEHGFAVIQFPFNLYEAGAALHLNNLWKGQDGSSRRINVLDYAQNANLGILTNRPFNTFFNGRLARLTSFKEHNETELKAHLHKTLGRAIALENEAPKQNGKPLEGFLWAHALRDQISDLDDIIAWQSALQGHILPSIRRAIRAINAEDQAWLGDYKAVIQDLLLSITHSLENLAHQKSQPLIDQLHSLAQDLKTSTSLSQKVLRIYLGHPQISSVLVGMKKPEYVRDVLETAPALSPESANAAILGVQRYRM
jgi:aryl-alcohol dehydrogenase-like predicted oxidoreductase